MQFGNNSAFYVCYFRIIIGEDHIFHPQENIVHEIGYPTPCCSKGDLGDSDTPANYCHECKKEFRRHSALVSHIKMHLLNSTDDDDDDSGGDNQQFESGICSEKIKSKNDLEKNRGNHFRKSNECQYGDFETYIYEKYAHKQNHSKSDVLYKCSLCDYYTTSKNAKNEHLKMHALSNYERPHVNEEQGILYQCHVCNYQTRDMNLKNDHLKEHRLKDEGTVATKVMDVMYRCCRCNYWTQNESDKVLHEETVHKIRTVNTLLQCDVCFQEFSELGLFFAHRKIHTELECRECGRLLSKESHMLFHRLSHVGKFSNVCCVCDSEFSMHTMLEAHESVHKEKVNCVCNVCGETFVLPSQMFMHHKVHRMGRNVLDEAANMKLHYAKEGYLCKHCGKNYEDIIKYTEHMVVHWKNTEYRLKCSICEDIFETVAQLVSHRKTHPQMLTV
jgi:KRAB domain-containing zinc finger protein